MRWSTRVGTFPDLRKNIEPIPRAALPNRDFPNAGKRDYITSIAAKYSLARGSKIRPSFYSEITP